MEVTVSFCLNVFVFFGIILTNGFGAMMRRGCKFYEAVTDFPKLSDCGFRVRELPQK
jgi:hypothetical protein